MKISFKPNRKGWIVIAIVITAIILLLIKKRRQLKKMATTAINYLKEKTWDWKTERVIDGLHPLIRAKAKEFIIRAEKELGIKLRAYSGLRTWDEQNELYAQGRTKSGKVVTNAKGGHSFHNFGLAFDVVEIKNGKALWSNPNWKKIAALGRSIGFEWGGDWKGFKDKPHFQYDFGKSLADLRQLYSGGQREGEYVNLA